MGLTNKLGLLAQSVQQDASLNIGIGGAANASYKLQVTGTTNLTGALSGTSATFSTDLVVNGWLRPNSIYAFTADSGTTYIQQPSGGNIVLRKSDSTPFLTIANTGAATFSSSVTATQLNATTTAAGYASILTNTNGASDSNGLLVKAGSTSSEYVVRFAPQSDASTFFTVKGNGNVGIGTSSPDLTLTVNGAMNLRNSTRAGAFEIDSSGNLWMGTATTAGNLYFETGHSTTGLPSTGTARMTITGGGNVGIGTSDVSSYNDGFGNRLVLANTSGSTGLTIVTSTGGNGNIYFADGTTGDQQYRGIIAYEHANDAMRFSTQATERMRITSGGNVGINTTTPLFYSALTLRAATTANYTALACEDSSSNVLFFVRNDGLLNTGTRSASPYNNTNGAGANMFVGSDGLIYRSTSSIKYKKNVEGYTKGLAEVMQLRPVTYNSINETETQTYSGLIAEEIHELGLTEFVQYAEDGTPDALSYGNMVALLVKGIQEQQKQIEELKALIASK